MRFSHDFGASSRRPAFTLVELLVVIGIIALLISILLPVLGRAQEQAKRTQCLANQRQLIAAARMYANDWKDVMPFSNWGSLESGSNPPVGWLYNAKTRTNVQSDVKGGLFWPFLRDYRMYRCPADAGPWEANTTKQMTSYLMNGAVSGYGTKHWPYKITQFKANDVIFFEMSEQSASGNDGSSFPDEPITRRHTTGTTVGCVDGHAETLNQKAWEAEQARGPSRLWCDPGRRNTTGGKP